MSLQIVFIRLDELAADPGSMVEGQFWYNTTEKRFKVYRNGTVQTISDKAELDAHIAAGANPHGTSLEEARTEGNVLSGNVDLGGNLIKNSGGPVDPADLTTQQWVKDHVDSKLQGLDWQDSVLDKDLATPPGAPGAGDRYIVASGGTGAWSTHDDEIAEWNGASWDFTVPNEGVTVAVEDENRVYTYNGAAWVTLGSIVDHNSLQNLAVGDVHTQYLLANGSRAMSGNLDMGSNNVTNVGLVDGVDVSAHADRHKSAGADEIDGDQLDIDWNPANYTPSAAPTEVTSVDQLTAHLKGIDDQLGASGTALKQKAGEELAASFSGNPKSATITFAAPFADANYALAFGIDSVTSSFAPIVIAQTAASFTVSLGSNNLGNFIALQWVATKHGEN